jgi:hypothetical protein
MIAENGIEHRISFSSKGKIRRIAIPGEKGNDSEAKLPTA